LKIQHKIVIPFTFLFVTATLLTSLVSISLMRRTLDTRGANQLEQASRMISRAEFALNSSILGNLKAVLGADVITYKRDGTILAATFAAPANANLVQAVLSTSNAAAFTGKDDGFTLRETEIEGHPYKIGYRAVTSRPDTFVAVIMDTSDIAATEKTIAHSLTLIAALIVALVSFIGTLVAQSVTAPLLALVEFTKKLAAGERNQKAVMVRKDETSVLTEAFNDMVEQLRRSEERALQSEKLALTGLLAARVAHEVRNPLSAIKMQAQLLQSKLKSAGDEQELVRSILRQIEQVEWFIRGMLDLASPAQLHLKRETLTEILDEVLDITGAQLGHRKVIVNRKYSSIPAMMLDRNRLKIAFLNLIMNASDAMINGGTLDISVGKTSKSVVVEIQDDGTGIDASVKGRLFNPFVTTKPEGVGLGLVNTKNILELHHGTIDLLPRNGRGARAVIELPIAEETLDG
jgi:signal transduction histidine kinase